MADPEKVERRSKRFRWFSLGRTIFWIILTPIAYMAHWLQLVTFVSLLSIWALVETAFAAYRADENPDVDRIREMAECLARIEARMNEATPDPGRDTAPR